MAAPGFIDIHSHGRRGIFAVPTAENYLREGVTTIVEGPDGSSPVPLAPFLDKVRQTPISINFATMVGQGSIREQVIGLANRKATPEEIEKMKGLAAQAMRDGAFGLSTGLFYVPGNYTPTEEVIELAKVVGRMGGIHISHMREEAAHVLDSVRETIRIGEEGGLPTQITHHKIIGQGNWGKSVETLKLVEEARARGVDVTIDQYPYTASSTGISALFPQWALEGGQKPLAGAARGPRASARASRPPSSRTSELDRGAGDPKNVVIANCPFDATPGRQEPGRDHARARRRADLRKRRRNAPSSCSRRAAAGRLSRHQRRRRGADSALALHHDRVGWRDSGVRPGGAASAQLRHVRARAGRLRAREEGADAGRGGAPHVRISRPQRLKLWDRGLLRPGMKADVVVFDADKIADRAEYERPHQYSVGVRDVIVNGKLVLRNEAVTSERPGRVLYGPAHR